MQNTEKNQFNYIQKLDELSLYLELRRYEKRLQNIKYSMIASSGNHTDLKKESYNTKRIIAYCLVHLEDFKIDTRNNKAINNWKHACSAYINKLSLIDYTLLIHQKNLGQNLESFYPQEQGHTYFLSKQK